MDAFYPLPPQPPRGSNLSLTVKICRPELGPPGQWEIPRFQGYANSMGGVHRQALDQIQPLSTILKPSLTIGYHR